MKHYNNVMGGIRKTVLTSKWPFPDENNGQETLYIDMFVF